MMSKCADIQIAGKLGLKIALNVAARKSICSSALYSCPGIAKRRITSREKRFDIFAYRLQTTLLSPPGTFAFYGEAKMLDAPR